MEMFIAVDVPATRVMFVCIQVPRIRLFCCAMSCIKVVGFADDLRGNIPARSQVKSVMAHVLVLPLVTLCTLLISA